MLQSQNPRMPLFTPGEAVTCRTPAAVAGGRIVSVIAGRHAEGQVVVGYGPAGGTLDFGVTSYNTNPDTSSVLVQRLRTIVMPVDVGTTAVVGGDRVAVDAEGRVVPAASPANAVGIALDSAPAGGRVYVDRNVR